MVKAVVALDNFLVGWYSTYSGYYFVTAPAGTYKLSARPANGPQDASIFPTYYENNFVVNSNTVKNITVGSPVSISNKTKISGYVLDANGNGLAGADIIFGVPDIVPSVYTNYLGYYAIYAPAGTYNIGVWPPFDSNYISYEQPGFSVGSSDIIKNITLSSGYKLSGYLTDSKGAPIRGALASLNLFHCGWYSNDTGYYFVTAPTGIYKLMIQPKTGPAFTTYTENNFSLTHDTVRNFTLTTSANTPASTSNPEPTSNSTSTLPSALLSITAEAKILQVGSTVSVNGKLSDQHGNPLVDKTVILSYSLNGGSSWFQIGSGKTNANGDYSIQWVVGASGTFTLKTEWAGDTSYSGTGNSTTLSFLPYQNQQGSYIESISTVSALASNSTSSELSFKYWALIVVAIILAVIDTSLLVYFKKRRH
jgi:protocatechuate 3,4-dioxygenase beta subunit